jgi:ubiquinone/menaquinone biosynthesis C-methylase UbiE
MGYPIAYGDQMLCLVRDMHAGSESLPGYPRWIAEHMGGRVLAFRARLLPQMRAFTDLRGLDILDFGCGTGSTTVVLAEASEGGSLTGIDVDQRGLEIAALRLRHHGLEARVRLQHIAPVSQCGDLPLPGASFDLVLANGVLEHVVPFAVRPQIVLEMWRLLRPGGLLYISETPNPLWPVDRHTTGLPFVSWLPRGLARRYAVACGRHQPGADFDSRGWRGMTYWQVVRPLRQNGARFEVLNLTRAGNRLLPAGAPPGMRSSFRRRAATFVSERLAGRALAAFGVPAVALGPFLEHLCLRKLPDAPGASR